MKFPNQSAKPYTRTEAANWVGTMGCYGIFRSRDNFCAYIGMGDIGTRLLAHLPPLPDNECIPTHAPDVFYVAIPGTNTEAERDALETALIAEFNPHCNTQKKRKTG